MLLEGQQLGRYLFLHLLESGGMGEVYLAEDTQVDRQVAIKVIQTEISSASDPHTLHEALRLFRIEAKAITMLDHPRILPLFDYGEEQIDGIILTYMVMPYREEGSLAKWARQYGRSGVLPLQEVAHFLLQAAEALQHAHDHGIIHRDVKPSNFLISSNKKHPRRPNLQLADFGVAKFIKAISTPSHIIRGTPIYMAPEQWRGEAVPATDQYALAVMIYELLTGHSPFQGSSHEEIFYKHLSVQPQPPSTFNPRIPAEIDVVLMPALLKDPEDRYDSVSAFARAFQYALINGRNIHVTVTVSQAEARTGTRRLITLPGGRRVTVALPAGAYDGQIIRFEGLGEQTRRGGPIGMLIITIAIAKPEEVVPPLLEPTVSAFNNDATPINQPQRGSKTKAFLLLGLVIIFILAGLAGLRLLTYPAIISQFAPGPTTVNHTTETASNRIDLTATFNADASATEQAGLATAQANLTTTASAQTATASVQSTATASTLNATVTAQAKITATAQAVAATATAYATTTTAGTLILNDPLQDNSQGHNWDVTSIPGGGGCAFANGAYHSSMPQQSYFSPCFAEATNFTNFSYQIQMMFAKGDQGGIAFRANAQKGAFYYFHINSNGTYDLETYNNDISTGVLRKGSSSAIKTGLNQTNLIAVVANGNQIDLYVNMQHVDSITDSTYSSGQIGVVAEDINNPTDVAFTNAQVWTR